MRNKNVIGIFTGAYSLVQKTGLLEFPLLRRGFVASSFLYKRWYEDPFWGLLQRMPNILSGGDVLDVGANVGYTAWVFAQRTAPGARIYAFEPDRSTYVLLEEVVRRRKLESTVEPLNMAVGSSEGYLELWHNKSHSADHRVVTEEFRKTFSGPEKFARVAVTTVDRFVEARKINKLSLIKIDVQGYELAVCQGMSDTLERFPDMAVCLEFSPDALLELGFQPEDVFHFFQTRRYGFRVLTREGLRHMPDVASIQPILKQAGYVDLLFTRKA